MLIKLRFFFLSAEYFFIYVKVKTITINNLLSFDLSCPVLEKENFIEHLYIVLFYPCFDLKNKHIEKMKNNCSS